MLFNDIKSMLHLSSILHLTLTDYTRRNYTRARSREAKLITCVDIVFDYATWGACSVWLSDFLYWQLASNAKISVWELYWCQHRDHWAVLKEEPGAESGIVRSGTYVVVV